MMMSPLVHHDGDIRGVSMMVSSLVSLCWCDPWCDYDDDIVGESMMVTPVVIYDGDTLGGSMMVSLIVSLL